MIKKWFYLGNKGVLAEGDQIKALENHCNTKPEDLTKFELVPFHVLRDMIQEAKDYVKVTVESKEPVKEEKPKRKRRTKAQIEADKASE